MSRLFKGVCGSLALLCLLPGAIGLAEESVFPAPIDFDQYQDLLAPLVLSDEQRHAANASYETYLDATRASLAGPVQTATDGTGSMPLHYHEERGTIVEGLKLRRTAFTRIAADEVALFDALERVLSEEQQAQLPRIIDRRTRWRLAVNPGGAFFDGSMMRNRDLSELIRSIELTELQQAAIEESMQAYEAALTPIARHLHAAKLAWPLAAFDDLSKMRAQAKADSEALSAEHDLTTKEGQTAYALAMTALYTGGMLDIDNPDSAASRKIYKLHVRQAGHNRRMLEVLQTHLSPDDFQRMEDRLMRRGYHGLGLPADPVGPALKQALGDEGLREELIAAIESLGDQHRSQRSALVRKALRVAEDDPSALDRHGMAMVFGGFGAAQPRTSEVDKVVESIQQLSLRSLDTLANLTGTPREKLVRDGYKRLMMTAQGGLDAQGMRDMVEVPMEGGVIGMSTIVVHGSTDAADMEADGIFVMSNSSEGFNFVSDFEIEGDADGEALNMAAAFPHMRPQKWIPSAMTSKQLRQLADDLELTDDDQLILDSLFESYQADFEFLNETALTPARELMLEVWRVRADSNIDPDQAISQTKRAMAAVQAIDDEFLAELKLVFSDRADVIDAAGRARRRLGHGDRAFTSIIGMSISGSKEQTVDIMLLSRGLTPTGRAMTRETLEAYDVELDELLARQWQHRLGQSVNSSLNRPPASMVHSADGTQIMMVGSPMMDDEYRPRLQAIGQRITQLNQAAIETLKPALSHLDAAQLKKDYVKAAFPSIAYEEHPVRSQVERSLGLELTVNQRQALEAIAIRYHRDHDVIMDRMVDTIRGFQRRELKASSESKGAFDMMSPDVFLAFEAMQKKLENDRFERRTLNQQTRQALTDLLGVEMAAGIGLRPVTSH